MKTIHEASRALTLGQVTPLDLVEQCLANVERWESRVKAWVFLDRDYARAEAKRLGEELKQGRRRGPLHGIPLGIKDIFDVFDWPTAAGSKLWAQSYARQDAEVVRRLRQAGAIFLGKTVTTQYASFDPPVTRNPWNLERTPGGSSSGSAAAPVTGMCLGAIGSQTGGSITRPASYCGAAGFKPTYGLVPCKGVVPLAPSMDHPGPMGRCVRDLAMLLQVMAGFSGSEVNDPAPNFQVRLEGEIPVPRLGRLRGLFEEQAEPVMQKMMDDVQKTLNKAVPAPMAEIALPASFGEVLANHRVVMAVEAAEYHKPRLERHPEDYGPWIRSLLDEGLACSATEYRRCKEHQAQLKEEMAACFRNVDALIMSATTGPAPDAGSTGNPAFNSPWSYTGLPTTSFPTGQFAGGMPLAMQVVGPREGDAKSLTAALWCEQVLGAGVLEVKG